MAFSSGMQAALPVAAAAALGAAAAVVTLLGKRQSAGVGQLGDEHVGAGSRV